jgi:hypothetical protein
MSQGPNRLSRRNLFAGAGTVGAAAAVASLLPLSPPLTQPAATMAKPLPEKGGGYILSEHVKRYYGTARV